MVDRITQEGIYALLPEPIKAGLCIEVLESTPSTNDYLKQKAPGRTCTYYVVIAEKQTRGKGRRGKNFLSPRGCGIYLSVRFQIQDTSRTYAQELTALSSVAACRAIETHTSKQAFIKWPNDVYCDGKKVCGILCESQVGAYTGNVATYITGIGINVYKSEELDQGAQNGGYLALNEEAGLRNRLAASLITEFVLLLEQGIDKAQEEYRKRSILIGQNILVEYDDLPSVPAHVQDINTRFQLVIRYQDGSLDTLDIGNFSIKF